MEVLDNISEHLLLEQWKIIHSNSRIYTLCPCDTIHNIPIPPFVGENYFCESGYIWPGYFNQSQYTFHSNDTLWDDRDCHSTSTCCSHHNLSKTLNTSTTDDIDLRICMRLPLQKEDIAVELIELYVKS